MYAFSIRSFGWIAAVWLVIGAQSALGQPIVRGFESLEWMMASSDLVLCGTLASVTNERDDDDSTWHQVEFLVAETLKGTPQRTVRFVVEGSGRNELVWWREQQRSMVVFLNDSRQVASTMAGSSGLSGRRYLQFPYAARSGHCERSFVDLGADSAEPVYSLSLDRRRGSDQILPVLKAAAKVEVPARLPSCTVAIPGSGQLSKLTIPVDDRVEAAARQWAKSSETDARQAAVIVLQYFQSPTNVDVLRGLLKDPGSFILEVSDGGAPQKLECRYYPVRHSAYKVLQAWGVDVSRPIYQEPLP